MEYDKNNLAAESKGDVSFHTSEGTTVEGMQSVQGSMEKKV